MGANDEFVFLGCYTGETGGEGEGIVLLRRDGVTGSLTRLGVAARTPSPSFLAQHPTLPVLYAVNELDSGTVSAFAVAGDGSLSPLAVQSTGGSAPCHLAVSSDGRHLLVANYASGDVAVHPLEADGVPGERSDLLNLDGKGPVADRQEGPHAHMVAPDPNGPDVLVCDLGSDRVWHTRLDPISGRLTLVGAAAVAEPGTGPRHLLRTRDGALLVVGELAADLTWFRPGASGALERAGACPASAASEKASAASEKASAAFEKASAEEGQVGAADEKAGGGRRNEPSELVAGRDGRFVYVANRGPDTVSVFAWEPDGGTLVAEVATGGKGPRHLALLADHLYVANERSHSVTGFRIDPDSGIPHPEGEPVSGGSPTCLLRWAPAPAA
ncbi:lactonase family protein [Couchioplanes caeruleus]|uniref:3-carboxymuconate cyclase n=2 Tax=Couchioplanes caeruleus TaxID=56438 RepID=A0A1K0GS06_9ACTN|nr:lactonase family protein [Couchioplanes caeruleus]OJF12059.1 3-carboxymuconate cyclase [Couchioplanes caeruleus subsp. caeruleus]ROP29751.1 6-phosphogluconolactonase (cycloisomerase 2 family) [Couchioplanes caeruleus]